MVRSAVSSGMHSLAQTLHTTNWKLCPVSLACIDARQTVLCGGHKREAVTQTFFFEVMARQCHMPHTMLVNFLLLAFFMRDSSGSRHISISAGCVRAFVSPTPSCPSLFEPQENIRPLSVMHTECSAPHATTQME